MKSKILETLLTTQRGWIVRQVLKFGAYAGAAFTSWLVTKGVTIDNPEVVVAATVTLVGGLAEMGLSFVSSYIRNDS
jgi:hypothetical protein